MERDDIWIVMPAYNEEPSIGRVIDGLNQEGYDKIIVVDDGSDDRTGEIARSKGAQVIRHSENRGLGSALRSGLNEARNKNADVVVTFDADGQHDPSSVSKLVEALGDADLVVGVRDGTNMPLNKRFGNFILDVSTYMLGGPLTDSQSGFRAFGRQALGNVKIRSELYEVSSEIMIQAKSKGLRIRKVPISGIFTNYSKARGTTIASGVRIILRLIGMKVKEAVIGSNW